MRYKFTAKKNYSSYASGSVLYSLPGRPAFPVRLASEIFMYCGAMRSMAGFKGPHIIFDPCCGSGYLLTVIGLEHRDSVKSLIGSDIDSQAVELTLRNLTLLGEDGVRNRIKETKEKLENYGRESYKGSLKSLNELLVSVSGKNLVPSSCFVANAAKPDELLFGLKGAKPDIIISDVPYGEQTMWAELPESDAIFLLLDSLRNVVHSGTVIALTGPKRQVIEHPSFRRIKKLKMGTRLVTFMAINETVIEK